MADCRNEELIFSGHYQEALTNLHSQKHLTTCERALCGWAELELGATAERAQATAASLLKVAADDRTRAFALMLNGKTMARFGSPEKALVLTRRAIELAATIDISLQAEFLAQHVICAFWIGFEPAVAELPRLRQLALKTGNRNALVEYHLAKARVAAFRNLHHVASHEARVANGLLLDHANPDQLWRLRELQANAALMDSDLDAATQHSEECIRMATEMGVPIRALYARANLAYIYANTGHFELARQLVLEANAGLPPLSRARLAVLSTGIHIGIATRDHVFATAMLQDGLEILKTIGNEQNYYALWFELQHVRYLLSDDNTQTALHRADAALEIVPRLADFHLLAWFRLIQVEALIKLGKLEEARSRFDDVFGSVENASVEVIAEALRVAGLLCAAISPNEPTQHMETSDELLNVAGLHGLRVKPKTGLNQWASQTPIPDSMLFRLGLLLRLGRNPAALGRALLSTVQSNRALRLRLEREDIGSTPAQSQKPSQAASYESSQERRVSLGETGVARYYLRSAKPSNVDDVLLLDSMRQVITSASVCQGRQTFDLSFESNLEDLPGAERGVIATSEDMLELVRVTRKLAPSNITVLITGETGTGKELFARALHDSSPRNAKPFIPFNCSAVSRDMLDAQLFGYRKGAFTGAADAFPGVIRAAAGGTLFLDEIGEVALEVQPKLLRFLESGEIHPLGEARPMTVDVRVVAATNANLEQLVEDGRFREDLFYRLNVVRLHVPPLRERREEIPPLVQHYLDKCSREAQKSGLRIADETMEYLILFKWPGNVRQLANEIRRLVALAETGAVLMPEHLSPEIAASRRTVPTSARPLAPTEFVVRMDQPMSAAMEHLERSMIQYALSLTGGRVEDAATRLGLSRKGLYLKRHRLAMQEAAAGAPPVPA